MFFKQKGHKMKTMRDMRNQFVKSKDKPAPAIPRRNVYPFVLMMPGDYSEIEFESDNEAQIARRCANVNSGRRKDSKFITRITRVGGLFKLEVWCVSRKHCKTEIE